MDMLDSRVPSFLFLMHVLQAFLTFLSSHSVLLLLFGSAFCALYLPCFLFSALARLSISTFISSFYRSELFFHPVLLHETRASLKASLLFLVCP